MNYCKGNYETVTTNSGQKLCLKKCNKINANYITDTSDQTVCKEMSGTRVVKTISRNLDTYRRLNQNGNNSCQTPVPARIHPVVKDRAVCTEKYGGVLLGGSNTTTSQCYYCYTYDINVESGNQPVRNAQGVYMCN
jgi:hypothetical protein